MLKKKHIKPILIVDNLSDDFGKIEKNGDQEVKKLRHDEEVLLTLIAGVVVKIILTKEL